MPKVNIREFDFTGSGQRTYVDNIVLAPAVKLYGYDVSNGGRLLSLDGMYSTNAAFLAKLEKVLALPDVYEQVLSEEYEKQKSLNNISLSIIDSEGNKINYADGLKYKSVSEMDSITFTLAGEEEIKVKSISLVFPGGVLTPEVLLDIEKDITGHTWSKEEEDGTYKFPVATPLTINNVKKFASCKTDSASLEWLDKLNRLKKIYQFDLGYVMLSLLSEAGLPIHYCGVYDVEQDPLKVDGVKVKNLESLNFNTIYNEFVDKSKYDPKFITPGIFYDNVDCLNACLKCASDRGDSIAVLSVAQVYEDEDLNTSTKIDEWVNEHLKDMCQQHPTRKGVTWDSNLTTETRGTYGAVFTPNFIFNNKKVVYYDNGQATYSVNNVIFPAYLNYLLAFAENTINNPDYFAIAGYQRGSSAYSITPLINFGDVDADIFEPREGGDSNEFADHIASNPICNIPNEGYLIWGNRTMHPLSVPSNGSSDLIQLTASSFLNIRHICCDIKKNLFRAAKYYSFEPNTTILWFNFKSRITPLLNNMKSNQGIRSYQFIKSNTNVKAVLAARIVIEPIEPVEDFDLTLELTDSLEIAE